MNLANPESAYPFSGKSPAIGYVLWADDPQDLLCDASTKVKAADVGRNKTYESWCRSIDGVKCVHYNREGVI